MTTYEILLFLHVALAIVWLGSGLLLSVLGSRAEAMNDLERIKGLLEDSDWLTTRLFIPSSLAVLVLGIALTIDGPWEFSELWILIGLAGYAASFLTGLLFISRQVKTIDAVMERDGGMSRAAAAETARLQAVSKAELAVLFAVVLDMVVKPTADDVGALVLMAAVVAAGVAYAVRRLRAPVPDAV